ncbi:MAG: twin transmembrane helix small protein [Pseudomonadota bacterium]
MADDPLFYVVAAACLVVLVILLIGVGGFAKGGDFNRKHANRIMRLRLLAQFVAVILLVGFVWLRAQGGN